MKRHTAVIFLLMLVLLIIAVIGISTVEAQSRSFILTRSVIGSGGLGGSAGLYTLTSTLGQPVAGSVSGGGYELGSGFWGQVLMAWFENFLPLIFR